MRVAPSNPACLSGKRSDFSGGGALGAIVLGATAARLWPAKERTAVQAQVNAAWAHLQPALFGLLGAAVDVQAIEPALLGSGLAVIGECYGAPTRAPCLVLSLSQQAVTVAFI